MTIYSAFNPTALRAGDFPMLSRPVTIKAGSNSAGVPIPRGAVLGAVAFGAASSAAKAGGNTGNGTLALDGTTPVLVNGAPGVYQVRFTSATAYTVADPKGLQLGNGANGTAFADRVKFTTTAGGTAFVAGDGFDITVAAGAYYSLSLAAAVDGSQVPRAVLAIDTDASGADTVAPAYFTGEFADLMCTFGTGHTQATVDSAFAASGQPIFIRKVGAAA